MRAGRLSVRIIGSVFLFTVAIIVGHSAPASATPIFTINTSPTTTGLSFATSVFNFTTPYLLAGGGTQTALLGAPDGGFDPNTPQYVDFGGSLPWTVSVGFGTAFSDQAGVDVRLFTTQLDPGEGFDILASADGTTFFLLGNYPGPAGQIFPSSPFSLDIDFNGTALPAGARYLRFSGLGSQVALGFDFDAIGVVPAPTTGAAVPEPATLTLVGLGLAVGLRRTLKFPSR